MRIPLTTIFHKRYLSVLLQEVDCGLKPKSLPLAWWQASIRETEHGIALLGFPKNGEFRCAVLLNNHHNFVELLNFLEAQLKTQKVMEGGLAFIDIESGTLLQTNWELGETEEWWGILEAVTGGNKVTHTFSATDLAIDVVPENDSIRLQLLDWEAIPNRLETSRENEPVHVFEGVNDFIREVEGCLRCLESLIEHAQHHPTSARELTEFLSVRARLR